MNNTDICTGQLTINGTEQKVINITSNGDEISEQYLEKEYQENSKDGQIYNLLKNIISIQQKTNEIITEFVNVEKIEKQAQQQQQQQSTKKKGKGGNNKGNNKNNSNNENNNNSNKRNEDDKEDDKIIKQQKLD